MCSEASVVVCNKIVNPICIKVSLDAKALFAKARECSHNYVSVILQWRSPWIIMTFTMNNINWYHQHLSRLVTKPTKWLCAQQRLRSVWASAQSDQSSLSALRKLRSLATHWAHSEDSDQTGQMPKLIRVFDGRTCQCVGFVMRWLISILEAVIHSSLG